MTAIPVFSDYKTNSAYSQISGCLFFEQYEHITKMICSITTSLLLDSHNLCKYFQTGFNKFFCQLKELTEL